MNERLFRHLLDVYGADTCRWPDEHQAAAIRHLATSAEARQTAVQIASIDRLLTDGAPRIDEDRAEKVIRSLDSRLRKHDSAGTIRLPGWTRRWGINRHIVYAWLFILGCLANLLMRFGSAAPPLDLLFSTNLLSPLGG